MIIEAGTLARGNDRILDAFARLLLKVAVLTIQAETVRAFAGAQGAFLEETR